MRDHDLPGHTEGTESRDAAAQELEQRAADARNSGVVAPEFFLRAAQRWSWKILWPEGNTHPKLEDVPRKLQGPRQTETEVAHKHEVPETWEDLEPRDVPENWDDIPSPAHMTDVAGGISEEVVLRFPVTVSIECHEAPQMQSRDTGSNASGERLVHSDSRRNKGGTSTEKQRSITRGQQK